MSRMATSHRFIEKNSIIKIPASQILPSKPIPEEIPTSITIKVVSFVGSSWAIAKPFGSAAKTIGKILPPVQLPHKQTSKKNSFKAASPRLTAQCRDAVAV